MEVEKVVKELDTISQHIGDLKRTELTEQAHLLVEGGKYLGGAIYLGEYPEVEELVGDKRSKIREIMLRLSELYNEVPDGNHRLRGVLLDAIATLKVELEGTY